MNELQSKLLDIYCCIADICEKHSLRHFAIGGTAIGTIRHEGFIPWDDDLDIAMPIEDYKVFLTIAEDELPSKLKLFKPSDSTSYESPFCKVMDECTTVIQRQYSMMPERYTGAWVDVMPMSGVPREGFKRNLFIRRLKVLLTLHQATVSDGFGGNWKYRAFAKAVIPLRPIGRAGFFMKAYNSVLYEHPFDEALFCGYTWSYNLGRLVFPKSWFDETVQMPFETTLMRIPAGWDKYLKQQFGDYMKIPPKSEQVTHDTYIDLKNSYHDYAAGRLSVPTFR